MPRRSDLPTGTVTFLFTDVEGSTKLLHELGAEGYAEALAQHRRLIREACASRDGVEVDTQGDAFFYAFPTAEGALQAAREGQEALEAGPIRVRLGLHTGSPLVSEEGYVGEDVHLAARVAACGHGGQIVLSKETASLLDGAALKSLGSHRLKDVSEPVTIYQLGERTFPHLKTIANSNLPTTASSFLGREAELYEADSRLQETRLLTVIGPGGAGKTRFALELAIRARDERFSDYEDGVFSAFLSSLRDPSLVVRTIAVSLDVREQPGQSVADALSAHLAGKKLLLLLDNVEHLMEAVPALSALLSACPGLTVLATSRERLRLQGEGVYELPPLRADESVALFCERAQTEPDDATRELCAQLEGLPLAIELAAARTSVLTPQQIATRLSQRLDFLKGGPDRDPRQETLRATIDWSYDLLSPEEKQLLARLSVFAGGCTLEAAEEVCDADLDTLQSLVEKSLVRFTNERYWMLETIREYAGQQLDEVEESERLRRRHTDFFAAVGRQESTELRGSSREGGDRLEAERANLRVALSRAFAQADVDLAYELATAYGLLCIYRGPQTEGRAWLDEALRVTDDVAPLLRERALGIASDLAKRQGDLEAGRLLAEKRLELARTLGDSDAIGAALDSLGVTECYAGNFDRGEELQREAVAVFTASANDIRRRHAIGMLGFTLFARGAYAEAREVCQDALTMSRAADDSRGVGIAASHLGYVLAHEGSFDEALLLQREALLMAQELHDVQAIGAVLLDVAVLAISLQDYEVAGELLGAVAGLAESNEFALVSLQVDSFDETLDVLRRQFARDELDRTTARGREMQLDEIVGHVVEFTDSRT